MIIGFKKYLKDKVFRKIWNKKGVFPYLQHQVFFPKDSIIFHRAITEEVYELAYVKIINALIKEHTTVFDVGANIGLMSIPMLLVHKNINVVSVEPSPNSFPYLAKTQSNSPFKNRWTVINKACSDEIGTIDFQLAQPENAAYESIKNTARVNFIANIAVACTTLDQIWIELAKPEVSFIKVDIEGADLLALKGALNCIAANRPAIIMEWNKKNIAAFELKNQDLLAFTKSINYTIYALPPYAKCETVADLELLYQLNENFLLMPNDQ